jgi:hypothetical protein
MGNENEALTQEEFKEDTFMKRVIFALLVITIVTSAQAKYSGGTGSPDDPYLISTAEDMNQIGRNYTDWDKCFKLTADINLSAYTGTQFSRIGTDDKHAFSGVFDGNGYTISGFTYTAPTRDYIGVFGDISGTIENVSLVDVNITGRSYVGGLVGYSGGNISNCYSAGVIRGGDNSRYIGGLVGCIGNDEYWGYINNCHSTSVVTGGNGSAYLGGLAGQIVNSEIGNCYSTGAVTGGDSSVYLGGLVGVIGSPNGNEYEYWDEGYISNCHSTGTVTGGDYSYNLGGLVGGNYYSYGYISECYSTGAVSGGYDSDSLGGLVGYEENCYVADCYATGEVAGDYDAGGLVGLKESYSTITGCYSSGSVSGYMYVGGLVGWDNGGQETTDSFWDTNTSGQSWSAGGTGKTTVEMKTKSTFTDAGWNFDDVWHICETTNYPKLLWQILPADLVCPDGVNFVDYSFFAERWLNTNCASNNNCDGADFDFSGMVDIADLEIFCDYWLKENAYHYAPVVDTNPPTPNPMTWAVGGEPNAISDTQITMTATDAFDAQGVEYYFTNLCDANHNSGWQLSTTYTDTGLYPDTNYTYNVKARDKALVPNETAPSTDATARTPRTADTTCPDPNPAAFATRPTAISDTGITMTATTATDAQGPVQYYFTNKTVTGHNSGWQLSPTYTDTGLAPDTNYGYTVKARDNALVPNVTAESNEANATTGHDVTPPDPNPATFAIAPHATGATTIAMQATIATDTSVPVWYQFRRFNPDASTTLSGWQTDSNFTDTGLAENTTYSYQVRTKDSATIPNVGAWSITTPSATTSITLQTQINNALAARGGSPYTLIVVTAVAGTYNENLSISEPNVTLQSASGAATTIIQLQNTDVNGIRVIAAGCTIGGSSGHGFTIKSAATGTISVIDINQNNTVVSYCDINGVPGVATRGVRMTKANGVTIANNNFVVDGNGVSLGGGPGYPLKNVSITGNTFTSLGATGPADTNSFVTIEGSDACNVQITSNTTNDGMVVQVGPNNTNLINITISDNSFTFGGILLCEVIGGAVGEPCDANRLQSMTITSNTFAAGSNGYALLIPSGAVLTTVALEPNDVNWTGLTFANNKVLRTPGGPTYKTVDNLIGTTTTMKTGTLNAKHNWWGSATGPTGGCSGGIGASITSPNTYILYQPFWLTATGTDVNCP